MSRVAKRYAKALFELALEEKELAEVESDFEQIAEIFKASEEFNAFLVNPLISELQKSKIIATLFAGKFNNLTNQFLQLLAQRKRSSVLYDVVRQFQAMLLEYRNIVEGELFSAVDLNEQQLSQIQTNIEMATGKSVLLKKQIEPAILGGFVLKVQDIIIDNSIRFQLNKLREQLRAH